MNSNSNPLNVTIAGLTGYTGIELARLLHNHPGFKLTAGTSERFSGKRVNEVFPHLGESGNIKLTSLTPEAVEGCDALLLALPHGLSGKLIHNMPNRQSLKIVDLGADLRLVNQEDYRHWYQTEPPPASLVKDAVYGLPELYREQVKGASLVANPGCFVTASTLAAAPLLKGGLIRSEGIVFDCVSGVSGAGRSPSPGSHYGRVNENFKAYNIGGAHRHTPEIEQNLNSLAPDAAPIRVTFTPHLAPMTRGLMATAYFSLSPKGEGMGESDLHDAMVAFYEDEPFVRVRPRGELPETKDVLGSNYCDLGLRLDKRTGRVLVVSVIDNLVKGASGQALQNLNLMFGFPEETGLMNLPIYP